MQKTYCSTTPGKNWTIVRPYITYNTNRLQLGVLEKEYWLYRSFRGRPICFHASVGEHLTTLSHGYDVALLISRLIGNQDALGEAFHIAPAKTIRWNDVLQVYLEVLEDAMGKHPKVQVVDDTTMWEKVMGNHYQLCYDRCSDRIFDNSKVYRVCGQLEDVTEAKEGLRIALKAFLQNPTWNRDMSWPAQAYMDKCTHSFANPKEMKTLKSRLVYLFWRIMPVRLSLYIKKRF